MVPNGTIHRKIDRLKKITWFSVDEREELGGVGGTYNFFVSEYLFLCLFIYLIILLLILLFFYLFGHLFILLYILLFILQHYLFIYFNWVVVYSRSLGPNTHTTI